MIFSEKCTDPDEKSYYACGNSSRPSLFAKVSLRRKYKQGKQNYFSLLKTAKVVVSHIYTQFVSSCSKYSNVFVLTLCMMSNVFFLCVLNIA